MVEGIFYMVIFMDVHKMHEIIYSHCMWLLKSMEGSVAGNLDVARFSMSTHGIVYPVDRRMRTNMMDLPKNFFLHGHLS